MPGRRRHDLACAGNRGAIDLPGTPEGEDLKTTVLDRVATVTLDRAARRNALTAATMRELRATLAAVDAREDVDVIVLTGSDPAFCAGLDLDELATSADNLHEGGRAPPVPPLAKPLIGAINGAAVAGGLELAMHCDFLVASVRARFADTHARVGVVPGWGAAAGLPHGVGARNALSMSLTARFVDAEEALRIGLVSEVVEHERLLVRVGELARQIVGNDQPTVRALLALMRRTSGVSLAEGLRMEVEASAAWRERAVDSAEIGRRKQSIFERNSAG
jgi:enoyl-CoA hydratase/carnithine racemase